MMYNTKINTNIMEYTPNTTIEPINQDIVNDQSKLSIDELVKLTIEAHKRYGNEMTHNDIEELYEKIKLNTKLNIELQNKYADFLSKLSRDDLEKLNQQIYEGHEW